MFVFKIISMKPILLYIALLISTFVQAQDLDIYPIRPDEAFKMPEISSSLTEAEFVTLSTTLRMRDMMYAMIIPGHAHFHIGRRTEGLTLAAIRTAAYAGMILVMTDGSYNFWKVMTFQEKFDQETEKNHLITYGTTAAMSVALIFGTYFYDWLHANYVLDKKTHLIRYRYSLKMALEQQITQGKTLNLYPTINFKLKF